MADNEQLYSSFAKLEALEKQKNIILGYFGEVKQGVLDLSKLGITIDSAKTSAELAKATKNLQDMQEKLAAANKKVLDGEADLEKLRAKAQARTKTTIDGNKAETDSYNLLSASIGDNIKRRQDLQAKLKSVKSDASKLSEFAGVAKGSENLTDELVRLGAEEARLKLEIEQTTRFIKNQTREFLAAEGSLDELRAKLNQMLQAYDAMSDADKNSDFGKGALKSIAGLTDEIKKQEFATKRFQRNVGNYNESAKIIVEAFERMREKVEAVNGDFSKFGPQGENMRKEFEALQRITNDPKFLNVAAKLGDATMETRYMIKALQSLEMQGLKDTEMFETLQNHIAGLTDSIADTRSEVKALSSDTRGFDLFASGIGTLASTFQTAASAAELFGDENRDVQKSIQKLMAIQNVANGVRQIATDLTTRGSAANKAYAFAQSQVAIMTNATSTATMRWAAALKLTGIGLLLAAIGYLADKMGLFGGSTADAEKELEKFNDALERQNTLLDRNSKKIQQATERNVLLIRASGAARAKAEADAIASLPNGEKELKELKEKNELEAKIRAATIIGLAKEANQRQKAAEKIVDANKILIGAYGLVVTDVASAEAALDFAQVRGDKKLEAALSNIVANYDKAQDARTQIANINIEGRIKKLDGEADAEKKAAEKRKKYAEDERKAAFDLLKFRLGIEAEYQEGLKNIEGTGAEGDSFAIARRRLAAQTEFGIRKEIILAQRDFDLKAENITASQKQLVRERAAQQIKELELKLSQDIVNIKFQERDKLQQVAKEEAAAYLEAQGSAAQAKADELRTQFDKSTQQLERSLQNERDVANKRFLDGKTTRQEYQLELARIDKDGQRVRLEQEIVFWEGILQVMRAAGQDTSQAEAAIQNARNELQKATSSSMKQEAVEKQIELVDQLKEKYKELGASIRDAFANLVEGLFESQKQQAQDNIDKIEEEKNAQIARVQAEGDAEEKKAARIKTIEAKAEADKAAQARRQKEIDRSKAIFERAFKGFEIGIEGIKSIAAIKATVAQLTAMSALNPFIIPLIPLAAAQIPITIATTAASLAALFATPIPKFAKGTTGKAVTGWGIVAEEGRELVKETSGRTTLHEKPTMLYMQAGTKVIPNKSTEKLLKRKAVAEPARAKFVPSVEPVKVFKIAVPKKAVTTTLPEIARAMTLGFAKNKVTADVTHAQEIDRRRMLTTAQAPAIQFPEDRTDEVVSELKKLNSKPPTVILSHPSVETTPWYYQNLKH